MLLIATVEKCGRKGAETAAFCDLRCLCESQAIAMPATIPLAENNLPQESFQGVTLLPYDSEPFLTGIDIECIEAFFIFQIGMDIRIVKVSADFMTFFSEYPQGIDSARSATDMQQDVQSQFTNLLLCEGAS
jgi:hypothetical protein